MLAGSWINLWLLHSLFLLIYRSKKLQEILKKKFRTFSRAKDSQGFCLLLTNVSQWLAPYWMHELLFVDFENFDQTWKSQSSQNVGNLTIIKNKSKRKLRCNYSIDLSWKTLSFSQSWSCFVAAVSNDLNSYWSSRWTSKK